MSSGPALERLFRPRSVAVVGASRNPLSLGGAVLRNLVQHRFRGQIYPVHPRETELEGLRTYPSVLAIEGELDLVNVALDRSHVPAVLEECGRKGAKFVIVHTAGFKELGQEGLAREQELTSIARAHGLRLFGPNSQGVENSDPAVSLYANFTFTPLRPGTISILAQSGGMGELLQLHLHRAGVGQRLYASYGNESDVSLPELLEYCGEDEGTRVILLQMETLRDPEAFLEIAARVARRRPILALKSGRSAEAVAAVASHTGRLADQRLLTQALLAKVGALEMRDTDEMIKASIALAEQPLPRGGRLALVTNTGGPAIQALDEAIEQGLTAATLGEHSTEQLSQSLHSVTVVRNPLDLVATATPQHYATALRSLLFDDAVDLLQVYLVTAPFADLPGIVAAIADSSAQAAKPIVAVMEAGAPWAALAEVLRRAQIPVYEFPEDGPRALSALVRYAEVRGRSDEPPPRLIVDRGTASSIVSRYRGQGRFLPQLEAFTLIAAYGIPIPRIARVTDGEGLSAALERVGFPCVLKVDSTEVVHKSEAGGVVLDLIDNRCAVDALSALRQRFSGAETSFVLQEQRPRGLELFVGASASPGLGHLVLFGLGGTQLELSRDLSASIAPLSRSEAARLMRRVRAWPAVQSRLGATAGCASMEDLLLRVSRLISDFPEIGELDLNPVLAYPPGSNRAPCAVDVRIRIV